MSDYTISINIGVEWDEIINDKTIPTMELLFNTRNPEEIIQKYIGIMCDDFISKVSTRKEYRGHVIELINNDKDDVSDVVDADYSDLKCDGAEASYEFDDVPEDVTESIETILFNSLNSKIEEWLMEPNIISEIVVSSKYGLTIQEIKEGLLYHSDAVITIDDIDSDYALGYFKIGNNESELEYEKYTIENGENK